MSDYYAPTVTFSCGHIESKKFLSGVRNYLELKYIICKYQTLLITQLQIRGGNEDNSKIFFLISQRKHILRPSLELSQ